MMKLRLMRWVTLVAHMAMMRNTHKVLNRRRKERGHMEDLYRLRIMLKWLLKELMGGCTLCTYGSEHVSGGLT
jgi:hypothetical protein